jgi:hypothetical protein
MKNFKTMQGIFAVTLLSFGLVSCDPAGTSRIRVTGNENELPQELKGLKVYSVSCGEGDYIKVAILNDKVVGTSYSESKYTEDIAIIQRDSVVPNEQVIFENDTIKIVRKN